MAKKILFITKKLRPYNGPEAFQSTMIAKYLSMNCELHVISTTSTPSDIGNARHHYIPENETGTISSKIESAFSKMGLNVKLVFQEVDTRWIDETVKKAEDITQDHDISTVITRSSPAPTHLIGLGMTFDEEMRWICSMSDPISINPYLDFIFPKAKKELLEFENKIFERADIITHTNTYLADEYSELYPQHKEKFYILSNMYDREISVNERLLKLDSERMVLSYAGRLYGKRNPAPLFKAINKFTKKMGQGKIRLNLIGTGESKKLNYQIKNHGLNDIVTKYPFLDEQKLFELLKQSHLLVTISEKIEGNNFFSPSKNYDYLSVVVPILGITSHGATADLIEETRSGTWAELSDVESIYQTLVDQYNKLLEGYVFTPDIESIKKYHAKEVINKLCNEVIIF